MSGTERVNPESMSSETEEIVDRSRGGDREALEDLFSRHRERLRYMIRLRLDPRVRGRLDESDVLQDVYMEAARRLEHYLEDRGVPFFIWLRALAGERIIQLHRRHLGVLARDVRREVPLERPPLPVATSAVLAAQLLGNTTTPSEVVARAEIELKVREALESLDPSDREVLVARHFERLTNAETAYELGIKKSAASKRYVRAVLRLREALESMPGGWSWLLSGKSG